MFTTKYSAISYTNKTNMSQFTIMAANFSYNLIVKMYETFYCPKQYVQRMLLPGTRTLFKNVLPLFLLIKTTKFGEENVGLFIKAKISESC